MTDLEFGLWLQVHKGLFPMTLLAVLCSCFFKLELSLQD